MMIKMLCQSSPAPNSSSAPHSSRPTRLVHPSTSNRPGPSLLCAFCCLSPPNIIITKWIAAHLVGNTGVQSVQASNDMGHVQKGSSILHHLAQHRVCLGKFPTVTKKYIIKKFQKLHCIVTWWKM